MYNIHEAALAMVLFGAAASCSSSVAGGVGGGDLASSDGGATSSASDGGGSSSTGSGGASSPVGGSGGGVIGTSDPNLDGPYAFASQNGQASVPATGHTFAVRAFYPTSGPTGDGFPLVIVGHGFQLPSTQYEGYAKRLASFGYVAVTAEFPAGFLGNKHTDNAKDLLGAVDWALADGTLGPLVDGSRIGLMGHSLGGKAALLAATMSPDIGAVLALDPVDSAMSCSAADCPDVSALMPGLAIPTGILGETLDSNGGFQPCAPAADNFQTFYAGATSPSFSVDVLGANHMSFLDDPASCGFQCSFCQMPTADHAMVIALSRAYTAAFFERHLRGVTAYASYLTGAEAMDRYVTPGLAKISSR